MTLSGLSMVYQTHRFPLFWATTTSLPGTPLNIRTETQHGALHAALDVIQVELNVEKETEVTMHSDLTSNIRA